VGYVITKLRFTPLKSTFEAIEGFKAEGNFKELINTDFTA